MDRTKCFRTRDMMWVPTTYLLGIGQVVPGVAFSACQRSYLDDRGRALQSHYCAFSARYPLLFGKQATLQASRPEAWLRAQHLQHHGRLPEPRRPKSSDTREFRRRDERALARSRIDLRQALVPMCNKIYAIPPRVCRRYVNCFVGSSAQVT